MTTPEKILDHLRTQSKYLVVAESLTGGLLTASFAAIDRRQDAKDVRAALDQAIGDIQGSKTRLKEAYDLTYSYKAEQPKRTLSGEDRQALDWANKNPNDPRSAQIKNRLGEK